jgi:hypothetical protein
MTTVLETAYAIESISSKLGIQHTIFKQRNRKHTTALETADAIESILSKACIHYTIFYLGEIHNPCYTKLRAWAYELNINDQKFKYFAGIGNEPDSAHIADILYCLLMAEVIDLGQTFENWCADFGYDKDSRSAHKRFSACKGTTIKMREIFTSEQIDELRELLADY